MQGIGLLAEIQNDLAVVDRELYKCVGSPNPLLTETSTHLLQAGGKRLRPAFVLLAGRLCQHSLERLLPLAMALEMIHMASLVHDDVIDASLTRRGVATVKAQWGNRVSIHTGDYLFAKSLALVSQYNNPRIIKILADVSVEMCEGEIQQIATAFDTRQSVRDYLLRIKRKTALLISTSCQLGAMVSGAPERVIWALTRYGHYLGMAFQITDDILDLTADEKTLGKPVGSDIRQGIITLPIIRALRTSSDRRQLERLVAKVKKTNQDVEDIIELVIAAGGVDYSFAVTQAYLAKAKAELEHLPAVPTRQTLAELADFINIRKF
ncbi:MAG: heptaprenyl diphosphate synthase [Firmicutes bacterium]|nr:heptaprenyl diphosphate synthase [Bacillota bacterium]